MSRLLAAFVLLGCTPLESEDPHPRIIDQSGAEFFWACGRTCRIHRIAGVSPPLPECSPGDDSFFGMTWGRFFEVVEGCRAPGEDAWGIGDGRLLVCSGDADCPQLRDGEFECREGFCQNVDIETFPLGPPNPFDLRSLCTGHVPWGEDDRPSPELEAELEAACSNIDIDDNYNMPCASIPDSCPDPG